MQNQVKIMDHQVDDHIQRAGSRRMPCGPHRSEGTGEREECSASGKGRIEAFDMSDLQDALVCLRYHSQFRRLCRGFRNRLFQQHIQPLLEEGSGQSEMRGNRCRYS